MFLNEANIFSIDALLLRSMIRKSISVLVLVVADVVPDERKEKDEKHFPVYTIIICSEEGEDDDDDDDEGEGKMPAYRVFG